MAFLCAVVSGAILTAVVLITVFILRLFGQKGSVSLLVVAGSDKNIHYSPDSSQSGGASVLSSLSALMSSVPLVFRLQLDIVLCNGPGTCVPLCAAGLLLGMLGLKRVLITLSLSGKILYYFSDYFFVQWASLKDKYPKAIYLGRLV
uniref:UDP-N-acetylglucosamine transferase subunit ALG14 n=1 Tax=Cyprinus carpio TaxID=7962 RepID=A0A8C1RY54_CYPCA